LISPFKSIREIVGSICGSLLKYFVAERFRNIDNIKNVTCPTLIIHGQKDELVPYTHSLDLSKNCGGPFDLVFPEEMDHNDFNPHEDFLEPIHSFLKRNNLLNTSDDKKSKIPAELVIIPEFYYKMKEVNIKPQKDIVTHYLRKMMKI